MTEAKAKTTKTAKKTTKAAGATAKTKPAKTTTKSTKPAISVKPAKAFKNSVAGNNTKKEQNRMRIAASVIVVQSVVIIILSLMLVVQSRNNFAAPAKVAQPASIEAKKSNTPKQYKDIIAPAEENGNIGDHVLGKADSDVVVITYVDMQCPACAKVMPIMNVLQSKYGDRVAFIYRYYVITGHDYARAAAIAVEAAGKQGYYEAMLNKTFSMRAEWAYVNSQEMLEERFASVFKEVSENGGNVEQFRADLKDENLARKVDFDWGLGKKDAITATPTILVNGVDIDFSGNNAGVLETAEKAIEKVLK